MAKRSKADDDDLIGDPMKGGHNTQGAAAGQLRAFVERIERLEEEKKTIGDDIKDVYSEAKGNGFDVKALRTIVRMRKQDANERAEELMDMIHLDRKRDTLAMNLTYAEQRALEIGITIAGGASVILLDEPTAGMSRSETTRFIHLIRKVTEGRTLLTVEHDMGVVFGLADKIAVVVYGEVIAFDTPDKVRANARVQEAYLGSAVADAQAGGH